ncbi:winged helix-turn-helix transcriptional regulator [Nocardioides sp. JQ2195]|uniref:ArsR/SmtB family transcription factor n=1 Tax=Nocardioides sp. JQ2195 TaxID=2592334 RepID=UPI00143E6195|nr:metalloregulator ArsR/SmtB family transcription factor [Nocardioides sp. JQ2195]QIX25267.1 winged helix-turn-helix transcriptional regulator [Nocardioides sp. JQ2195]
MTTSIPINQAKADLFRTLGHPVRIRVLELLVERPTPVRDLLATIDVESSNLSQQLAVLRRAGLVTSTREGSLVVYSVTTAAVADLLVAGRAILASLWSDTEGLLHELRDGN